MDEQKILEYVVRIIIILLILPIHEYAHAWMANKLGDDTARLQGRLTINPFVHVDIFGAICLFLTGFGWAKPVPVNPIRFKKSRRDMAITALAGPASNLIVAFFAIILLRILSAVALSKGEAFFGYSYSVGPSFHGSGTYLIFLFILYIFVSINIGLFVFNLLPVPPLDGSKILSYFTSAKFDKFFYQYQQYASIIFIVIVFSGILDIPLRWLIDKVFDGMIFLTGWVDAVMNTVM